MCFAKRYSSANVSSYVFLLSSLQTRLTSWCTESYLQFNVKKTKEIVIDLRRNRNPPPPPLTVNGETVECVTTYKYLGVITGEKLNWNENTVSVYKKCRQRLHFM